MTSRLDARWTVAALLAIAVGLIFGPVRTGGARLHDLAIPTFSDTGISKPEKNNAGPSPYSGRRVDWGLDRLPARECNAEQHTDYGGDPAFVWGMNFRVKDAAECCEACLAHRKHCADPLSKGKIFWEPSISGAGVCGGHMVQGELVTCNVWVFCGERQCFSFDIHNHSRGECWLKRVADPANPEPWNGGPLAFPKEMREARRAEWPWAVSPEHWPWSMPEMVSWDAGAITDGASVTHRHPDHRPDWHRSFCANHNCASYRNSEQL
mmetsp:Transcript_19761/g.37670  ORF Transcript_19761/g.37670 Transcript_19761/m.37670 type:complete len:266 (+) Transcript_19761:182-979(+)|eukprot:CAMPEP_0114250504 /NCGR_PEP_ID=MMETSP0058-20121206/14736_1 /TAXON_ID=36894 /ORGANISM="Pyramimonas parkeae, CCMP726" /LENGTH=265 /DNA_ID=CAMNT_0001364171 /DNA_START=173 /DNA_END=970 /DNA_ORIENTATION=-